MAVTEIFKVLTLESAPEPQLPRILVKGSTGRRGKRLPVPVLPPVSEGPVLAGEQGMTSERARLWDWSMM